MKKVLQNNPLVFLIFLYAAARGFMLLVNGVWWDDWIIWNAPRETLVQNWITEGNTPHLAAVHLFIYDHFATDTIPFVYRTMAFLSGLVSLILIWKILQRFDLPAGWRFGITALVASSPLNTADITICCMMYVISTPLFYGGVLSFLAGIARNSFLLKALSSVLFFLSLLFWMSPIVLIPVMLLVVALWQVKPRKRSAANFRAVLLRCLSWWYVWIVPIVFWVVRSLYFTPKAQFSEYYAINPKAVALLPFIFFQSLVKNVVGFLGYVFTFNGGFASVYILVIFVSVVWWLFYRASVRTPLAEMDKRQSLDVIWLALLLFFGAMVPTVIIGTVIGDTSNFTSLQSRYQVLMLLPVALIIYVLLSQFRGPVFRKMAMGLVVSLSAFATMRTYVQYQKGWFKQLAVAELIRNEPLLHEPHVNVIVKDMTLDWNEAPGVPMPDYAYTGISNLALGRDQTHRYISSSSYRKATEYDPRTANYTIAGAEKCADPTRFHYVLVIDKNRDNGLSLMNTLKMTLLQYANPESFRAGIAGLLNYTLLPVEEHTRINVEPAQS